MKNTYFFRETHQCFKEERVFQGRLLFISPLAFQSSLYKAMARSMAAARSSAGSSAKKANSSSRRSSSASSAAARVPAAPAATQQQQPARRPVAARAAGDDSGSAKVRLFHGDSAKREKSSEEQIGTTAQALFARRLEPSPSPTLPSALESRARSCNLHCHSPRSTAQKAKRGH